MRMGTSLVTRHATALAAVLAAAVVLAVSAVLAGCGSGGAPAASGTSSRSSPGTAGASAPADALARSPLRVLTRLRHSQLCSVLSAAQAARILRTPAGTPAYLHTELGNTCQWVRRGAQAAGSDELYVGISSVVDWTGAQAIDRLLRTRQVRVDGHPGLAAGQQARLTWAQVDVALGGPHDPVAEYRAPTLAMAVAMARTATPHVIALG